MPELIQTVDLTKTYTLGEVTVNALQGVTLTIERGSFVAIMGASGSGKSTLMNLLGCLDRPTSGRYWLDGVPVEGLDRDQLAEIRNQKIGFVFQNFNLLSRMSATENVQLPLLYMSGDTSDADERARRVLALVGLAGREHSLPTQLSGGQQQRIAIARALINEPEILLADEPTGQLDSHTSTEIMGIFQRLNRDHGITIVVVTHSDELPGSRTESLPSGMDESSATAEDRFQLYLPWTGRTRMRALRSPHETLTVIDAHRIPGATGE